MQIFGRKQTLGPKKNWFLGLGLGSDPRPKPKTQRDPDSEFDSIHFGIEINKCLEFLTLKKILGLKN
jgi:hypothetical protein